MLVGGHYIETRLLSIWYRVSLGHAYGILTFPLILKFMLDAHMSGLQGAGRQSASKSSTAIGRTTRLCWALCWVIRAKHCAPCLVSASSVVVVCGRALFSLLHRGGVFVHDGEQLFACTPHELRLSILLRILSRYAVPCRFQHPALGSSRQS